MRIELSDDDAMMIRVALASAAWKNEDIARRYADSDKPSIKRIFRKRANNSFALLNTFREATGWPPVTLAYLMGEEDEDDE